MPAAKVLLLLHEPMRGPQAGKKFGMLSAASQDKQVLSAAGLYGHTATL